MDNCLPRIPRYIIYNELSDIYYVKNINMYIINKQLWVRSTVRACVRADLKLMWLLQRRSLSPEVAVSLKLVTMRILVEAQLYLRKHIVEQEHLNSLFVGNIAQPNITTIDPFIDNLDVLELLYLLGFIVIYEYEIISIMYSLEILESIWCSSLDIRIIFQIYHWHPSMFASCLYIYLYIRTWVYAM